MNALTKPRPHVAPVSPTDGTTLSSIRVNSHGEGTAIYHCSATTRVYIHFRKAHTVVFAYCAFMYSSVGSIDITDILPFSIFKAVEKEIKEWIENHPAKVCQL